MLLVGAEDDRVPGLRAALFPGTANAGARGEKKYAPGSFQMRFLVIYSVVR
jgi:hypothetical protein